MQSDTTGCFQGGYLGAYNLTDSFTIKHTLPSKPDQGLLFRQDVDRVTPIYDLTEKIEFSNVSGYQAKPLFEIVAQVYDFQNYCHQLFGATASDTENVKAYNRMKQELLRLNKRNKRTFINSCRNQNRTQNKKFESNSGGSNVSPNLHGDVRERGQHYA
jgi:hypothetical protein